MAVASSRTTEQIVDHFFRHESARVISHLSTQFGTTYLEEAEDAVQEALIKAMNTWPFRSVPDNPSGWILTVARNKMIDTLRRNKKVINQEDEILYKKIESEAPPSQMNDVELDDSLNDDVLKMMFACCHPSLNVESQIILTLRILCGLGNSEVARALLKKDEATAKAYTRAKQKLKDHRIKPTVPNAEKAEQRLGVILKVLYLLFNEGYKSSSGNDLIKKDLCLESMRLTKMICDSHFGNRAEVNALMALMCFHTSRFESRIGKNGELLTLKDQDRTLWNGELIETGSFYFHKSYRPDMFRGMTEYHIQAAMAGLHCRSVSYEKTDWGQILELYNLQIKTKTSPVVELNRLVVYAKVHGPKQAMEQLQLLEHENFFSSYYLYHAVKGDFLIELGQLSLAKESLKIATRLSKNQLEKEYLIKKVQSL